MEQIQIKAHFGEWKTVNKETAYKFIKNIFLRASFSPSSIIETVNKAHLKGITAQKLFKDMNSEPIKYERIQDIPENTKTNFQDYEILTAKNQYNYTTKQIIIDHNAKSFKICGQDGKIAKKNSTKKAINKRALELLAMGYKQEGGSND